MMKQSRVLALIVVFLLGAGEARGDTVALRSFARVAPGAAVTVGDVAELSGAEAEGLRGLVVQEGGQAGATVMVDLARVREVLKGQAKLNMGRLTVSGG